MTLEAVSRGPALAGVLGMTSDAHFLLARARASSADGDLKSAAESLQKMLELDPTSIDAREALAEIVGANGRPDLEISILAEVIRDEPSLFRLASKLVRRLSDQKQLSDAKEFAVGFLYANPTNQEAFDLCLSLGVSVSELGAKEIV
jgi:hypothetical protein